MGCPKLPFVTICQPAHRVPSRQTKRRFLLHIPAVQVIFDLHHVFSSSRPPVIIIIEIFRQGKIEISEEVMVHGIRTPIPMRSLELIEQHEGFFRITLGQPIDTIVFDDLRGMARALDHRVLAIYAKLWIEVRSLPSPINEHFGVVKSRWLRTEVPFPNYSGFITIRLENLGKGHLRAIKISAIYIFIKPIEVRKFAGQNG